MVVELVPRWERERAAWMVRHARGDGARRRAEVALRRMRARDRREQGSADFPAVEAVMPSWPVRWVRGAPAGERGQRVAALFVLGVVVPLVWGPALLLGGLIYASWWIASPRVGPVRVSVLAGFGFVSTLFALVMAVSVGDVAWGSWWIGGAFFTAGVHAWRHGWIVTEEWVQAVRDRLVSVVNRATVSRSDAVEADSGLAWGEPVAVRRRRPRLAVRERVERVRGSVERLGERVHAGDERWAAAAGLDVARDRWGGRVYRDPRFDERS